MKKYFSLILVAVMMGCAGDPKRAGQSDIDTRSYNLGIIGAFSEVVNAGVKKLALSEAVTSEEMDLLIKDAQAIAERNHVLLYRESEMLVTDLFPASHTKDKHVLLIYKGSAKDEYLTLKQDVWKLEQTGAYSDSAKKEISRRFGKLLSYPDAYIDELMSSSKEVSAK
jgi:hypothetical protein